MLDTICGSLAAPPDDVERAAADGVRFAAQGACRDRQDGASLDGAGLAASERTPPRSTRSVAALAERGPQLPTRSRAAPRPGSRAHIERMEVDQRSRRRAARCGGRRDVGDRSTRCSTARRRRSTKRARASPRRARRCWRCSARARPRSRRSGRDGAEALADAARRGRGGDRPDRRRGSAPSRSAATRCSMTLATGVEARREQFDRLHVDGQAEEP